MNINITKYNNIKMDKLIVLEENKIMRYNNSRIDKTTFKTGKRFNNFIEVKMISNESDDVIEDYKIYKIKKSGNFEWVIIKNEMYYNGETCKYEMSYYLLGAGCKYNKLWDNEDDIYYNNWKKNYDDERDSKIIDEWYCYLGERFKDAKFTICMDNKELKEILTTEKVIIVKQDFSCSCFNEELIRPKTRFFTIKNDIMSVENVIDELIKQDCKADCNHSFLEFFEKKTDVQFDIFFGS